MKLSSTTITFSTWLTITRILMIPFIMYYGITKQWDYACVLFCCAALTDILDGFLARLLHQQTYLGAFLDPVADKLLITSLFFISALQDNQLLTIPWSLIILVIFRELCIAVVFIYSYYKSISLMIAPTFTGKLSTTINSIVIAWLYVGNKYEWSNNTAYTLIIIFAQLLIIGSLIEYAFIAYKTFKKVSS